MALNSIDAKMLSKMFLAGAKNLEVKKEWINELNVFPVPDGDTGTNMTMTIMAAAKEVATMDDPDMATLCKAISSGSLRGARGNSGVILSQIFKGFYEELESDSIADVSELCDAFIRAYKTAYKSVARPVEGTLLTVAREGIENIRSQIGRNVLVPNLFSMYLAELRKSLANTPEMLPVLKEAKVVDSGGYGYVLLIEGMEKSLYGEKIVARTAPKLQVKNINQSLFNENLYDDVNNYYKNL